MLPEICPDLFSSWSVRSPCLSIYYYHLYLTTHLFVCPLQAFFPWIYSASTVALWLVDEPIPPLVRAAVQTFILLPANIIVGFFLGTFRSPIPHSGFYVPNLIPVIPHDVADSAVSIAIYVLFLIISEH